MGGGVVILLAYTLIDFTLLVILARILVNGVVSLLYSTISRGLFGRVGRVGQLGGEALAAGEEFEGRLASRVGRLFAQILRHTNLPYLRLVLLQIFHFLHFVTF